MKTFNIYTFANNNNNKKSHIWNWSKWYHLTVFWIKRKKKKCFASQIAETSRRIPFFCFSRRLFSQRSLTTIIYFLVVSREQTFGFNLIYYCNISKIVFILGTHWLPNSLIISLFFFKSIFPSLLNFISLQVFVTID